MLLLVNVGVCGTGFDSTRPSSTIAVAPPGHVASLL